MSKVVDELRKNRLYLADAFIAHGNKKLKDCTDPETGIRYCYVQANLRAKTTCPFATEGCKSFCYAKRDERFPRVRLTRDNFMEASKSINFVGRMIYTIEAELSAPKYNNPKKQYKMIVRIHESGDFYNLPYLAKWVDIMAHFVGDTRVIFQFYTKCFRFFLQLDGYQSSILDRLNASGQLGFSLSIDDTTTTEQRQRAIACRKRYPYANYYVATKNGDKYGDHEKCRCENCAGCGECVRTTGKTMVVDIH